MYNNVTKQICRGLVRNNVSIYATHYNENKENMLSLIQQRNLVCHCFEIYFEAEDINPDDSKLSKKDIKKERQ